jgi:heme-degrading monooxygenase HmoA
MPLVFWHGLKLRRSWSQIEGAVGLSIMSDLTTRTTYTITVWRDQADLNRWVRSAGHAPLMRAFRPRLQGSAVDSWQTDKFALRAAWSEALRKVGLPQAVARHEADVEPRRISARP